MASLILCTATRVLLPLLLLFSVFLMLRGHNEPGGGFSGGLVAAAAYTLHALAFGVTETKRTLPAEPRTMIGLGLLLALASGALSLLDGLPYLTGTWVEWSLPGDGKMTLGTPVLFDLGVYLVVIGATLHIILSLVEEQK